jgi:hypothetical protein
MAWPIIWLLLYFGPIPLFVFGVVDFQWRFPVFFGAMLIAILISAKLYRRADLGLSPLLDLDALKAQIPVTIVGLAAVGFMKAFEIVQPVPVEKTPVFYLFYFLLLAPAQEFVYRSIPFAEMDRLGVRSVAIRYAALIVPYVAVHIVYQNTLLLLVSMFGGAWWAYSYLARRNWLAVAVSHAIVGCAAVALKVI